MYTDELWIHTWTITRQISMWANGDIRFYSFRIGGSIQYNVLGVFLEEELDKSLTTGNRQTEKNSQDSGTVPSNWTFSSGPKRIPSTPTRT